ncbi:alpha/beta hydrolase [Piscirickettsia litoralis]|uniref:Alpha/beta hydrolase n=1 Tax=Piscirickettsia litoralis TaxID=1891921 RepID=A0ABX3A6P2_9GAMM|nr:alpha/beta hydrolase [Piscirickettsia litoralis]ODN43356.1 alpha/beta hydrolase [Piscirickettsia litoralis]
MNNNRLVDLKPSILRTAFSKLCENFGISNEELFQVKNDSINTLESSIPIRTYTPIENSQALPVIIYLHGGGHMVGSIDDYDSTVRALANRCQAIIIAVEYRLAPEHPYPAGLNDCLYAIESLHEQFKGRDLYIAGDSAGGNLTALTTLHLHEKISLAGQILIYPSLDFTLSSPSHMLYQQNYFLEKRTIEFYFDHYFNQTQDKHRCLERITASPLLQPIPNTLPKTLIITADLDPLRDDGIGYHQKLQESHVQSELYNVPKMIHAFMNLYKVVPKQVENLFTIINQFINQHLKQ